MNTQEIGFSEIMQIIVLIFFAALLIGFSIAVLRIIYMLISDFLAIHKLKKPFDYEKEACNIGGLESKKGLNPFILMIHIQNLLPLYLPVI